MGAVQKQQHEMQAEQLQENQVMHDGNSITTTPAHDRLPFSGFRKEEYVRLILQSLFDMGFKTTALSLEQESGFQYETRGIYDLRESIMHGNWARAEELIQTILTDEHHIKSALYMVKKQKYIEMLEQKNTKDALHVLRNEIALLEIDQSELHELSSLMMCSNMESLQKKAGVDQQSIASRRIQVYEQFQEFVPSSLVLPPHRLESLLKQAVEQQKNECIYHTAVDRDITLYQDHVCLRDEFPRVTTVVLDEHKDEVWFVLFSHNGKFLASASKDSTVIIWSTESWTMVHNLVGHEDSVSFLAWSPDDTMIISCSNDKKAKLWDTSTGTLKNTFSRHTEPVTSCAWFSDNQRFITGGLDKAINMWNVDGNLIQRWTGLRVTDLAVTADDTRLVAVCTEQRIRIFDMIEKTELYIEEGHSITSLTLSHDSKYALVNVAASEIHLWDLEQRRKLHSYTGQKQGTFVIRSCFGGPGQSFIISGSEDCNVYIWHRDRKTLLETLQGHTGTVNSVSWNPVIPTMFASASDDCTIRVWGKHALNI